MDEITLRKVEAKKEKESSPEYSTLTVVSKSPPSPTSPSRTYLRWQKPKNSVWTICCSLHLPSLMFGSLLVTKIKPLSVMSLWRHFLQISFPQGQLNAAQGLTSCFLATHKFFFHTFKFSGDTITVDFLPFWRIQEAGFDVRTKVKIFLWTKPGQSKVNRKN